VLKPLNESLKALKSLFKPLESMLEDKIETIRGSMNSYQTDKVRFIKEQEEKIGKRLNSGNIKMETAMRKMEELDVPQKSVSTEDGAVSFVTIKKFEIMDQTLIPRDYLIVDETAIRNAMKANIEIPGVRYYEEQSLRNYR
jgi:hypothetical protein